MFGRFTPEHSRRGVEESRTIGHRRMIRIYLRPDGTMTATGYLEFQDTGPTRKSFQK